MRHDLRIEGFGYRLRPIAVDDSEFVVELRSDPELTRYLHPISGVVADQERWIERYYERPGDYYFVVERRRDARREGTVAVYDEDAAARTAEWGRWIIRPGSLAALESATLVYRAAFDELGLEEVRCLTVADNARVVSFHDSYGLERVGVRTGAVSLGCADYDLVEHRLTRARWVEIRAAAEAKAERVALALRV